MKTTTHKTITKLAIELCKDKLSNEILENCYNIIQGSEDEDATQIIKRAINWHFYRDNDRSSPIPKKVRILFTPTSKKILKERIDTMILNSNDKAIKYNMLGRVLHHIQDMSTPSHVMPIYHGPKFPFKLSLGMIDDHFESFMERNDCKISTKGILELPSIDGINRLEQIYKDAADDMLKNILKIDEPIENRPYTMFWKHYTEEEYKKIKGFGMYGDCHEYFKKDGLLKNNPQGITKDKLLEIQDIVTKHAIINSCKALLYINKIWN